MGKQKLLRTIERIRAGRTDAPEVVLSRQTFGQGRLRQRYERMRERNYVSQFVNAPRVNIGRHTYGDFVIPAFAGAEVTVEVGNFCSIAANVTLLLGGGHNTAWVSTWPIREVFGLPGQYEQHPMYRGTTVIGNDVWIGRDAVIFDGVTIGHGAVIGTRALVTKDVRPYAIVAGVPAKEIRRRFTDEQVDALLEIAWWDWPDEKVLAEADALNGADISEFLARHSLSGVRQLATAA